MEDQTVENATFNYVSLSAQALTAQNVRVRNGRTQNFKLKGDGVQLLEHIELPIKDFTLPPRQLLKDMRDFMARVATDLTGATFTTVFPPLVRSQTDLSKQQNAVDDLRTHRSSARPHNIVHNDYAVGFLDFLKTQSPQRLREFLAVPKAMVEADEELASTIQNAQRIVILQFWASAQPEGTVIEDSPLAICAPRSVRSSSHLVPVALSEYGGVYVGEGFQIYIANAAHANDHEWFFFPKMTRDEMLVWVGYDSMENPFLPPLHSAFALPPHLNGKIPRESIEIRVMCFLDHSDTFMPRTALGRL